MTFLVSCGSSKTVVKRTIPTKTVAKAPGLKTLSSHYSGNVNGQIKEILKDAEKYLGAPYKYAGNTSAGFDCSGLVSKVFDENKMKLPRRSEDQSKEGREISIKEAKPGDLVFFATSGGSRVSHVGIIHDIGKFRDGFQKRIRGLSASPCEHACAAAQEIHSHAFDSRMMSFFAPLLEYCTAGHHAGLQNGIPTPVSPQGSLREALTRRVDDIDKYKPFMRSFALRPTTNS